MDSKIIVELQDIFFAKINEKNSWGKTELLIVWKDSLVQLLIKKLPTL